MKYTTKQIEEAAKKLRALPAKKRTKNPSSKQAVQMLQAEFAALLDRGYSLEQAGRALHNAGIEISPLTVLESLSAGGASKKRPLRTKAAERAPATSVIASVSPAATRPATTPPATTTTSKVTAEPASRNVPPPPPPLLPALPSLPPPLPPFLKAQRTSVNPPPQLNRVLPRNNVALPKASFQVRPDTPDSEL